MYTNHGSYILRRNALTEEVSVRSTNYGRWTAKHGSGVYEALIKQSPSPMPRRFTRYGLSFSIRFAEYFIENNLGHFYICARGGVGDADGDGVADLDGRGIVIGNVSQYAGRVRGASPAPWANCISVESFWPRGNCVYGEVASSPWMRNLAIYQVTLMIDDSYAEERGRIISLRVKEYDQPFYSIKVFDFAGESSGEMAGFTLGEVHSAHSWAVDLYHLTEWME